MIVREHPFARPRASPTERHRPRWPHGASSCRSPSSPSSGRSSGGPSRRCTRSSRGRGRARTGGRSLPPPRGAPPAAPTRRRAASPWGTTNRRTRADGRARAPSPMIPSATRALPPRARPSACAVDLRHIASRGSDQALPRLAPPPPRVVGGRALDAGEHAGGERRVTRAIVPRPRSGARTRRPPHRCARPGSSGGPPPRRRTASADFPRMELTASAAYRTSLHPDPDRVQFARPMVVGPARGHAPQMTPRSFEQMAHDVPDGDVRIRQDDRRLAPLPPVGRRARRTVRP